MLLNVDQLDESEKRFSAIQSIPGRSPLYDLSEEAFISDALPHHPVEGNLLSEDENAKKRKAMLAGQGKEPLDFAYERAIGKNDSVYSNFVELLSHAKSKVGRISCKNGTKTIGCATGFLVSENLILTNWHVFKTIDKVMDSEIQFFYELDIHGRPNPYISFKLRSDVFYHSNQSLDYCFVAVEPLDTSGLKSTKDLGYLFLDPSLGKIGNEEEELLNIIHHPDGDFKQLSIRENRFTKITPTTIWYESDTAPGSSGSPVFNDQWQIVALHHMGVGKKNDKGEYIDKYGQVIAVINGKIDESKVIWVANEGIRISVILKDIFSQFPNHNLINSLKAQPSESTLSSKTEEKIATPENPTSNINNTNMEPNTSPGNVNISFPATLIQTHGAININISDQRQLPIKEERNGPAVNETADSNFDEIKKLEEQLDLSGCKGYQSQFLSVNVPMPLPKKQIRKFIAKINNTDSVILKYYHYSVIFHTVRAMPVISAINVDGDIKKRQDNSDRKDVWLRDTRIDLDVQLDDQYYKRSGFDRGHMSRREDANWGSSPEDAKHFADLTCMYTNACPQIKTLNQSKTGGLWGLLEKIVLEKGAIKEGKKTRRISVFNGPIFKDNDPVYKGIQVPLSFYKIILWLTDDQQLKATAFTLSQEDLVGDIEFEQLDIDKNTEFKQYQCSIQSLEDSTGLDFSGIIPYDTFDGTGNEKKEISSEAEILNHLDKKSTTGNSNA